MKMDQGCSMLREAQPNYNMLNNNNTESINQSEASTNISMLKKFN